MHVSRLLQVSTYMMLLVHYQKLFLDDRWADVLQAAIICLPRHLLSIA